MYASTLSYIVDANPGRSAVAVSCNSLVRGLFGCILSQVASPLQDAIGDGGLFTLISGSLVISSAIIFLLICEYLLLSTYHLNGAKEVVADILLDDR